MTTQPTQPTPPSPRPSETPPRRRPLIVGAWLWVGLPLAYGLYELVHKAKQLFTG
ncbi:MFS transporter small subunit [Streptomyces flavofungini]|uniref:MFS transporter small subunit n=1 Tax=Streptomyces flavofungini TaxID=68200 RepID=UPI003F53F5B4